MTTTFPTYESIGVRPLINCKGTYTIISGSLMLPEVRAAMAEASTQYVDLEELMAAAGQRISEVMQCEWGLITNGCAAALCAVTAGIVAGMDREKVRQLPDTTGMKNEVIVQPTHRFVYDHAIRMVGVKMVEVETLAELEAAISERTAMMAIFGDAGDRGTISVPEMTKVAKAHGIPTFADAAAERPDVPNRYLGEGVDVVAYSGGKCLRGPQSAGLVLGRKDILQAAFANMAPHHSIGRPMKVGKEEIMGMLAAVEMWVKRDHEAEWKEWERRLATIGDALSGTPTLETWIKEPERSNVAPILMMEWDAETLKLTPEDVRRQLSEGEPRIEMFAEEKGVSVMPYMMEPGDASVVAHRIADIFDGATAP